MAEASEASVAVIMTCHNRVETTVACLKALQLNGSEVGALRLYVVDDGSTDGTSSAIARTWPGASITKADGSLYWAGGMALAERMAVADDPDYLVWLNDDTMLIPTAIATLIGVSVEEGSLAVGSVGNVADGVAHYGGYRRLGRHPQRLERVTPGSAPTRIDTFNGNCVLVPRDARARIGPIDGFYQMEAADIDYGYRATEVGCRVTLAPGILGDCDPGGRPRALVGGLLDRLRQMNGPRGQFPWRAQVHFLRRHGGPEWPLYLIWGYGKRLTGWPI